MKKLVDHVIKTKDNTKVIVTTEEKIKLSKKENDYIENLIKNQKKEIDEMLDEKH